MPNALSSYLNPENTMDSEMGMMGQGPSPTTQAPDDLMKGMQMMGMQMMGMGESFTEATGRMGRLHPDTVNEIKDIVTRVGRGEEPPEWGQRLIQTAVKMGKKPEDGSGIMDWLGGMKTRLSDLLGGSSTAGEKPTEGSR